MKRYLGHRRSWREMSRGQKTAVVVGGVLELLVTSVAARDLAVRDTTAVRGPKALWVALLGVQPLGPIGYLIIGRRSPTVRH